MTNEESLVPRDVFSLSAFIKGHLEPIADGPLDTGGGFGQRDMWVKIEGVEYFISIKKRETAGS